MLLKDPDPLSESMLWRVHDAYFEQSGVEAWSWGNITYAVTTGPVLAFSYARLVQGFAADCVAGHLGPIDAGEPLYVVELGRGRGRLGFHLLSALAALDPRTVAPLRVVYVLTNQAGWNVQFWTQNKRLRQFADAGRLDFARFDPTTDTSLHLERSGVDLERAE